MKPLTEIKKGCEKWFIKGNLDLRCGKKNYLCPTCQALLEQAQEFEKMILELPNPYPYDIYPKLELSDFQSQSINDFLLSNLKFPIDRLSAEMMRRARENVKQELLKEVQGEVK